VHSQTCIGGKTLSAIVLVFHSLGLRIFLFTLALSIKGVFHSWSFAVKTAFAILAGVLREMVLHFLPSMHKHLAIFTLHHARLFVAFQQTIALELFTTNFADT
jgi:hypothetical protein